MGDKLREIIDDESMDHMGFEEKIKLMLDAETIARSDRKVERLIRQAVLLQCLFDRFGSVFPQCGLMVFPGVVIVSR